MSRLILISSFAFSMWACRQDGPRQPETAVNPAAVEVKNKDPKNKLDAHWYQGKAEVSRYELKQNRYRDVHPGEAVLVFVTEDFLTDRQVKNERYRNPNSVSVLKSNIIRKFPTGIYDYSIMSSVFTPVNSADHYHTIKVSTSSQEWCGHTYTQLNLDGQKYRVSLHSYFEGEADRQSTIPGTLLEDELFNRIRISPKSLPTGRITLLPGTVISRLMHLDLQPVEAEAILEDYADNEFEGDRLKIYRLEYPQLNRTLEIVFEKKAPYLIAGWKDSYPSAFDKKVRTTIARRTKTIMSDYWRKNGLEDMVLRRELGLWVPGDGE